jgi:hypothetical protein
MVQEEIRMKSKNTPQTITRPVLSYAPLVVALGLVGAWVALMQYASYFPNPHHRAVLFYPLAQFISALHRQFIVSGVLLLIIQGILHGIAMWFGADKILTFLSFLGMSAATVCLIFLGFIFVGRMKPYDTELLGSHLYRLAHINSGGIWGYSGVIEAYTVLECDSSGLWCQYYSTPYLKERFSSNDFDFPEDARLEIDPVTQRLMLHAGQEKIDVEATDILEICRTIDRRTAYSQGYICG